MKGHQLAHQQSSLKISMCTMMYYIDTLVQGCDEGSSVGKLTLKSCLTHPNIKLKTALFFSFFVVYITVVNNIILPITQSHLSVA